MPMCLIVILIRSIGVQVNLCNCHCLLGQSISSLPPRSPRASSRSRHHFSFNKALSMDTSHPSETSYRYGGHEGSWEGGHNFNSSSSHRDYTYTQCYTHPHGQTGVTTSSSSRTARSSLSEMDSVSEADENNKLLEYSSESTAAMEQEDSSEVLGGGDGGGGGEQDKSSEASRLLQSTSGSGSNLNICENNQNKTPLSSIGTDAIHRQLTHHQTAADILNKRESHAYHFKRKYNFRSDSVFSDVTPMPTSSTTPEAVKSPEAREKSGSLSSLKGQSSKWASLRKKLGRLNSSSEKQQHKGAMEHQAHQLQQQHQQQQQHPKSAKVSLEEKRSLLQRAKTLSILPVNRAGREEVVKKPKEIAKPPELFNVGGEMNMIPLELLIDINDLKIQE
ncbi:unnamed protein product [Allacma fusca]|uniref:Uncharacterized protein n=1 Tax=Allacma fusca TaxID=39272 RepID=A0A8J2P5M8_9HEXA|nr:unnamed protein product [Allacma fusca]